MNAQAFVDLIEKLIDKKMERLHPAGKNLQEMQHARELAEIKSKLVELVQPLFT